jgi:hypothetical protein
MERSAFHLFGASRKPLATCIVGLALAGFVLDALASTTDPGDYNLHNAPYARCEVPPVHQTVSSYLTAPFHTTGQNNFGVAFTRQVARN